MSCAGNGTKTLFDAVTIPNGSLPMTFAISPSLIFDLEDHSFQIRMCRLNITKLSQPIKNYLISQILNFSLRRFEN